MQHRQLRRGLITTLTVSALSIITLLFAGSVSAAGMDLAADTTAPTVLSVKPLDGTADAAPNTNIGIQFSEPMSKPATEAAFKIAQVGGIARVTGTFTWIGSSLVFDPTNDLIPGAKYVATISTSATDETGVQLAEGRTWEFKIAGIPTTTPILTTVTSAPRAAGIFTGTLRSGNFGGLGTDDNSFFEVDGAKTWVSHWTTSRLVLSDWFALVPAQHNLKSLKVKYTGSASAKCSQVLSIYNWRTGLYEKLDRRTVDSNEVTIEASPVGSASDYISASSSTPDVLVRVQCERFDGIGFTSRGDLLTVTYEL